MGVLIVVLVVVVWIAFMWALWFRPLADAARHSKFAYDSVERTRASTISLIIVAGWIGGAYYLVRIRPELIAAEEEDDPPPETARIPYGAVPGPPSGPRPDVPAQRPTSSESRALFVRNIPADIVQANTIPLTADSPPLRCSRQDVIDAVLGIDPGADASSHRITVNQPGLTMTVSIPMGEPLSEVLLRVDGDSDQAVADRIIAQLVTRLGARAFDTGSPTLIFTPPA